MPSPQVCAKCKQVPSSEGDSWCSGCSAWEFIGREITASWDVQGARVLASDILVSAARQIKALRSLSSGLTREPSVTATAGGTRAVSDTSEAQRDRREVSPRRRSIPPPPAKEEEFSDANPEESGEEESDRDVTPEVERPKYNSSRRPPEPEGPPPSRHHSSGEAGTSRAHRAPDYREGSRRDRGEERSGKKRRKSSGHRGGRKHQRLARLAADPFLRVHRKPPSSFWELQTPGKEHLEPSHLGR